MGKPKRKLSRSGHFAKPQGPRGRLRDADSLEETHRDEKMMRGRENLAELSQEASLSEERGNVVSGRVVSIRGPQVMVLLGAAPVADVAGRSFAGKPVESPATEGAPTLGSSPHPSAASEVECILRKSTRVPHPRATALVVGDFVSLLHEGVPPFTLTAVRPRASQLARVRDGFEQVVCANVDCAVLVASAVDPPFKPRLVDRVLIAAQEGGLIPVLVINKSDLAAQETVEEYLAVYRSIHLAAFAVSATTTAGLDHLRAYLQGKTAVFSGQSGVGKSSLVNALIPDLSARTGAIQEHTGKGRHTTSSSTLYALPGGGAVIDTPGVRSFAVATPSPEALHSFFPEVSAAVAECRFSNCSHEGDRGCALPSALSSGRVRADRLESYLILVRGENSR